MLTVSVISPESVVFEGEATSVVAPAFDGEVGILSQHAAMVTLLGTGILRVERDNERLRFEVRGGFLQVADNKVRVVTEHAKAL